jgi:hypothetical protein
MADHINHNSLARSDSDLPGAIADAVEALGESLGERATQVASNVVFTALKAASQLAVWLLAIATTIVVWACSNSILVMWMVPRYGDMAATFSVLLVHAAAATLLFIKAMHTESGAQRAAA